MEEFLGNRTLSGKIKRRGFAVSLDRLQRRRRERLRQLCRTSQGVDEPCRRASDLFSFRNRLAVPQMPVC